MAVQVRQPHSFCSIIGRCTFTVWEPVLHWWSLMQLTTYHFRWSVCQILHCTNRSPRAIVLDLHVTSLWCVHSEQTNFHLCRESEVNDKEFYELDAIIDWRKTIFFLTRQSAKLLHKWKSHFRVVFCLCVKMRLRAKQLIRKCIPPTGSFLCKSNFFSCESFERLVLKAWNHSFLQIRKNLNMRRNSYAFGLVYFSLHMQTRR